MTKEGLKKPNYYGSITQASTCRVGNYRGEEMYVPMSSLLPMVDPNELVIGGWDISSANLAEAMQRAQVLDFELQRQLVPFMKDLVPLPGTFPLPSVSTHLFPPWEAGHNTKAAMELHYGNASLRYFWNGEASSL